MIAPAAPLLADIELQLLLEAVYRVSGYDFRDYTPAFLKRRVSDRMRAENVATISALQDRLLHDDEALERFIFAISIRGTKLFDDPKFWSELRAEALPMLRTFPVMRAWIVGCGRGEDAYSLAIILREAGLASRSRIYATDISTNAIGLAREGRVEVESVDAVFRRYRDSGGPHDIADFLSGEDHSASIVQSLRGNIVFSTHNLVCDHSFNEFHLIVCRDLFQQFNKSLAIRAHELLFESLARGGYLALGNSDTIGYSPHQRCFERVSGNAQIYRRVR